VFVLGLARDLDGDGTKDALAIVRGSADPFSGEVLFFKGRDAGVAPPALVATSPAAAYDPSCSAAQRIGQVGPKSAFVELSAQCNPPLPGGRWIAALTFDPRPRVHFSSTIADPPFAPALSIDIDGSDRDGDGIDDVAMQVTIDAPNAPFEPMPKLTAKVSWLDRPAGLSRDRDQPDASLRTLAQAAAVRAARTKEAPSVPASAHQIRALYGAICAEGGAPRITKISVGDGPLSCGASRALEETSIALVRAFATLGDPVRAAWALDRAGLSPATRTPARIKEAQAWITQGAPVALARQLRVISTIPAIERGPAPAWGPLTFEPSGKVLVRSEAGVVRVDPATGDETEAPDVRPWTDQVLSPEGALRWTEAYSGCDHLAVHATFAPKADGEAKDLLLPIAVPLGERCASFGTPGTKGEPARVLPLAWGARGLEAIVGGEPLLFASDASRVALAASSFDQPGPPGSPRSPNGRVVAIPTSQGIVVRAAKTRLFRAKELEGGYLELQGCTTSDDATLVACVRGGRAFVGTWDAQ
jgi:hypothetical protein